MLVDRKLLHNQVASWLEDRPEVDVFEDRDLEVTSYLDISLEQQIQDVANALLARQ